MKAGMLLLKIISDPWDEFIEGWQKIREVLNYMEDSKKVDFEEEILEYIFRSRLVVRQAHQPSLIVIEINFLYY
jgi:hypothetical protein